MFQINIYSLVIDITMPVFGTLGEWRSGFKPMYSSVQCKHSNHCAVPLFEEYARIGQAQTKAWSLYL